MKLHVELNRLDDRGYLDARFQELLSSEGGVEPCRSDDSDMQRATKFAWQQHAVYKLCRVLEARQEILGAAMPKEDDDVRGAVVEEDSKSSWREGNAPGMELQVGIAIFDAMLVRVQQAHDASAEAALVQELHRVLRPHLIRIRYEPMPERDPSGVLLRICQYVLAAESVTLQPRLALALDLCIALHHVSCMLQLLSILVETPSMSFDVAGSLIKHVDSFKTPPTGQLDRFYVWGKGENGRLGLGSKGNKSFCVEHTALEELAPVALSTFGNHCAVVDQDKHVWVWGKGDGGRLGLAGARTVLAPTQIPQLKHITQVACGLSHTLFLSELGHVFSTGDGKYGKLGHGDTVGLLQPKQIADFERIDRIVCGSYHSLATSASTVYAWGKNRGGQLGLGDTTERHRPTPLAQQYRITSLSSGWEHCLMIDEHGSVYTWGSGYENTRPVCGNGSMDAVLTPTALATFTQDPAVEGFCGWDHCIVLSKRGVVYTWGEGSSGRLGHGHDSSVLQPQPIDSLQGMSIRSVAAGGEQSAVVTTDGDVYQWGATNGLPQAAFQPSPEKVDLPQQVHRVVLGDKFAFAFGEKELIDSPCLKADALSDITQSDSVDARGAISLCLCVLQQAGPGTVGDDAIATAVALFKVPIPSACYAARFDAISRVLASAASLEDEQRDALLTHVRLSALNGTPAMRRCAASLLKEHHCVLFPTARSMVSFLCLCSDTALTDITTPMIQALEHRVIALEELESMLLWLLNLASENGVAAHAFQILYTNASRSTDTMRLLNEVDRKVLRSETTPLFLCVAHRHYLQNDTSHLDSWSLLLKTKTASLWHVMATTVVAAALAKRLGSLTLGEWDRDVHCWSSLPVFQVHDVSEFKCPERDDALTSSSDTDVEKTMSWIQEQQTGKFTFSKHPSPEIKTCSQLVFQVLALVGGVALVVPDRGMEPPLFLIQLWRATQAVALQLIQNKSHDTGRDSDVTPDAISRKCEWILRHKQSDVGISMETAVAEDAAFANPFSILQTIRRNDRKDTVWQMLSFLVSPTSCGTVIRAKEQHAAAQATFLNACASTVDLARQSSDEGAAAVLHGLGRYLPDALHSSLCASCPHLLDIVLLAYHARCFTVASHITLLQCLSYDEAQTYIQLLTTALTSSVSWSLLALVCDRLSVPISHHLVPVLSNLVDGMSSSPSGLLWDESRTLDGPKDALCVVPDFDNGSSAFSLSFDVQCSSSLSKGPLCSYGNLIRIRLHQGHIQLRVLTKQDTVILEAPFETTALTRITVTIDHGSIQLHVGHEQTVEKQTSNAIELEPFHLLFSPASSRLVYTVRCVYVGSKLVDEVAFDSTPQRLASLLPHALHGDAEDTLGLCRRLLEHRHPIVESILVNLVRAASEPIQRAICAMVLSDHRPLPRLVFCMLHVESTARTVQEYLDTQGPVSLQRIALACSGLHQGDRVRFLTKKESFLSGTISEARYGQCFASVALDSGAKTEIPVDQLCFLPPPLPHVTGILNKHLVPLLDSFFQRIVSDAALDHVHVFPLLPSATFDAAALGSLMKIASLPYRVLTTESDAVIWDTRRHLVSWTWSTTEERNDEPNLYEEPLSLLQSMGFERDVSLIALQHASYDASAAAELLLTQLPMLQQQVEPAPSASCAYNDVLYPTHLDRSDLPSLAPWVDAGDTEQLIDAAHQQPKPVSNPLSQRRRRLGNLFQMMGSESSLSEQASGLLSQLRKEETKYTPTAAERLQQRLLSLLSREEAQRLFDADIAILYAHRALHCITEDRVAGVTCMSDDDVQCRMRLIQATGDTNRFFDRRHCGLFAHVCIQGLMRLCKQDKIAVARAPLMMVDDALHPDPWIFSRVLVCCIKHGYSPSLEDISDLEAAMQSPSIELKESIVSVLITVLEQYPALASAVQSERILKCVDCRVKTESEFTLTTSYLRRLIHLASMLAPSPGSSRPTLRIYGATTHSLHLFWTGQLDSYSLFQNDVEIYSGPLHSCVASDLEPSTRYSFRVSDGEAVEAVTLPQLTWASNTGVSLSANGAKAQRVSTSSKWQLTRGRDGMSDGVHHWYLRLDAVTKGLVVVGIATQEAASNGFLGSDTFGYGFRVSDQCVYHARGKLRGGKPACTASFQAGTVLAFTLDLQAGESRSLTMTGPGMDRVVLFENLPEGFTYYASMSLAQPGDAVSLADTPKALPDSNAATVLPSSDMITDTLCHIRSWSRGQPSMELIQQAFARATFEFASLHDFEAALEERGRPHLDAVVHALATPLGLYWPTDGRHLPFPFGIRNDLLQHALAQTTTPTRPNDDPYEDPVDLLQIRVSRHRARHASTVEDTVFGQLQQQLGTRGAWELRRSFTSIMDDGQARTFKVTFLGEGVVDNGGPYRACFSEMAHEVCTPLLGVLIPSPNKANQIGDHQESFLLDPMCAHLDRVCMLGKLMGVALRHGIHLPLLLHRSIWASIAGAAPPSLSEADAALAHQLDLCTEAEEVCYLSDGVTRVSLPKGLDVATYRSTVTFIRQHEADVQMDALLGGLGSVVPLAAFQYFTPDEVQTLFCGTADFSISLLQSVTVYEGDIAETSSHVKHFWSVLEDMNPDEKSLFAQFTCARSRLPERKEDFDTTFKLQAPHDRFKSNPDSHLPQAHTCFFSLMLPAYSSLSILRQKLLYAARMCPSMDLDVKLQDDELHDFHH